MDYPYVNGMLKALEDKILDKNKLIVLNKYKKEEFVKILKAMNYQEEGDTVSELIDNSLKQVKNMLFSVAPKKGDVELFFLSFDAINIKTLYKIKKFDLKGEYPLNELGSINNDALSKAIIDDDLSDLSMLEKDLILELNKKITDSLNARLLSALIDNLIYQYALHKTKDAILKKYLKLKIDLTNILSLLRAKKLNMECDEFFKMFLENGNIAKDFFKELFTKDSNEWIKCLEPFYDGKISKALQSAQNSNDYEFAFDSLTKDVMSEYKDDPFNIGPVIYYYLLKINEAQNIRILYSLDKVDIDKLL